MNRRTKALQVSREAREKVLERDGCCVLCRLENGIYTNWRLEMAHYIGRGQGGLGIPENLIALCPWCHRRYDQTDEREEIRGTLRAYLKAQYPDWEENKLTYKKWSD